MKQGRTNEAIEFYVKLGKRVRALRERRGLLQEELALLANVRKWTMHRLETGKQGADLWQATQIANALGVGVDELIGGDDGQ